MANICIPPELIEKVKKIVSSPSSISRDKQLTDLFGGNSDIAKQLNKRYEETLLLKNQKTAIDKFFDTFSEVGQKEKAELKERIAARLANRSEKIQKDELLAIAQDIWDKKYKLDIPLKDIEAINKLKNEADALKGAMVNTADGSPERMAYGDKIAEISDIIGDLKNPLDSLDIKDTIKGIVKETGQRFSKDAGIVNNVIEGVKVAAELITSPIYKSVMASADASFALRQGFKVLTKDPKVWATNMVEAFKPFQKIASKKEQLIATRAFKARLVSHPLYDEAVKAKLAIGVIEEFFPTALAEKIPVLGNIFRASDQAFTIFSQGSRMGLFEDMVKTAQAKGSKMTPELYKSLATVANSITGRGSLGKLESVGGDLNKLFFSARYISSQVDTFTMPFNKALSPEARAQALRSSLQNLGAIATLMTTASLITDVEWNPQSSKFGKAKLPGSKDTWIDLTGGLGSYMTLAGRIATQKSKSSTTGKITELNSGKFGSRSSQDVLIDWFTNKLAPAPATINTYLKGKDFSGNKPTIGSSALNLITPITGKNMYDTFTNNDTATAFLASMFDVLGAAQTDYTKFDKKGK